MCADCNFSDKILTFDYAIFNPLHSYVECDSTSVFISGASLSSPTRHFFNPTFFREKENQDCILEIVTTYIIHLKITKYYNSVNKTGI